MPKREATMDPPDGCLPQAEGSSEWVIYSHCLGSRGHWCPLDCLANFPQQKIYREIDIKYYIDIAIYVLIYAIERDNNYSFFTT